MKLGIMQPYFFPYIGYFQLLDTVDLWIAFDDTQFIDKGWINRNRILHPEPAKEWQFITLPLAKRGQFDKIRDIRIKSDFDWHAQILGKLTAYKKKAPYYKQTIDFVHSCFDTHENNLARFVIRSLKMTSECIGIQTPIEIQSDMDLKLGKIEHPGQWALRISQAVGAGEYINPLGGIDIFNRKEFESAGVKLTFLQPMLAPYSQRRDGFVSGLSIIDVMMFNSSEALRELLNGYCLLGAST